VLPGPGYGTHHVAFEAPADAKAEILSIPSVSVSADLLNERALRSESEFLVFLHEEVRPVSADWVERLLEFCQLPGVGVVGPKLLSSDGRIRSAGIVFCGGELRHAYAGHDAGDPG
jgi:hypothetical protein